MRDELSKYGKVITSKLCVNGYVDLDNILIWSPKYSYALKIFDPVVLSATLENIKLLFNVDPEYDWVNDPVGELIARTLYNELLISPIFCIAIYGICP